MGKHGIDDLLHEVLIGKGCVAVLWLSEQQCRRQPQCLHDVGDQLDEQPKHMMPN